MKRPRGIHVESTWREGIYCQVTYTVCVAGNLERPTLTAVSAAEHADIARNGIDRRRSEGIDDNLVDSAPVELARVPHADALCHREGVRQLVRSPSRIEYPQVVDTGIHPPRHGAFQSPVADPRHILQRRAIQPYLCTALKVGASDDEGRVQVAGGGGRVDLRDGGIRVRRGSPRRLGDARAGSA